MTRGEFQELAGVGKTKYFCLLQDPVVQADLNYQIGIAGRADTHRGKTLAFIRKLRSEAAARRKERTKRLKEYATSAAPVCGRPCPSCGGRITRKPCVCRHCGAGIPVHRAA